MLLYKLFNVESEGERATTVTGSSKYIDPEVMIPLTQIAQSVGTFTWQCMVCIHVHKVPKYQGAIKSLTI